MSDTYAEYRLYVDGVPSTFVSLEHLKFYFRENKDGLQGRKLRATWQRRPGAAEEELRKPEWQYIPCGQ